MPRPVRRSDRGRFCAFCLNNLIEYDILGAEERLNSADLAHFEAKLLSRTWTPETDNELAWQGDFAVLSPVLGSIATQKLILKDLVLSEPDRG